MSEEVFRQDLDENKAERAGGPFVIELLFREPADMPSKERMSTVIEKHVGSAMTARQRDLRHSTIGQSFKIKACRCSLC